MIDLLPSRASQEGSRDGKFCMVLASVKSEQNKAFGGNVKDFEKDVLLRQFGIEFPLQNRTFPTEYDHKGPVKTRRRGNPLTLRGEG